MADIQKLYDLWLAKAVADPDLKKELESIKDDEDGKNDRFYRDLEFGTGGLRGVIGAGTMGQGIAKAFAQCEGYEVALCDIKQEWAEGGKAKIAKGYAKLPADI